jgi:hypothetical protein
MTLGLLDPADAEPEGPRPPEGVGVARRGVARAIDIVVLQGTIGLGAAAAYIAAARTPSPPPGAPLCSRRCWASWE